VPLQPRTFQLANGMKVVLVEDSHADMAKVLVRYRVGAIDDPVGQEGIAHLAAHLSYAPTTGTLTLWDQLDRIATWIDLTPDVEHTDFTEQTDPDDLGEVLKLEAQRLGRRCEGVTNAWFDWLRGQVRDEMRTNDRRLTNRSVDHVLYPSSDPYRRGYDATPDSVAAITQAQACAFMDQRFSPANTVIVVSGPVDARSFEQLIQQDLARVPVHRTTARPARPALPVAGFQTKVTADVAELTLAVAWPLPAEEGQRSLMLFGANLLAETLKTSLMVEDNHVALWVTKNASAEATIANIKNTLRTGLIEPTAFERTRSRRLTEMLSNLDSVRSRLRELARGTDLDAPFETLQQLTVVGFDKFVASAFDWSHARVIELEPDGSRPAWRPASLADPAHNWKGPSSFPDAAPPSLAMSESKVLANARTFQLANGMNVVLVPTSPVPLIELSLAFTVGVSSEPTAHHGTAAIAVSALEQVAKRGAHSAEGSWAAGATFSGSSFDSSGIGVAGPTMYADLLMSQFAGLAESQYQPSDVDKGHEALVRAATSPVHRLWDTDAAVRSTIYGASHPYGQAKAPDEHDVQAFDAREVEAFYRRYLQPNNATFIVTGGFDPDVVTRLIHQTFDHWQGKGATVAAQRPQGRSGAFATSDAASVVSLRVEWNAGSAMDQHHEARVVLGSMLNVVSPRVNAAYFARRQGGKYQLVARFDPATAAEEIVRIRAGITHLGSGSDYFRATFVSAMRRSARAYEGGASAASGWASWILTGLENGRDVTWLAGAAKRAAAVTYDEVAQLATSELALDHGTWLISGPHDAVAEAYAALGIQPTWLNP
jgi:predicted Zn-dependent peptidase